MAEGYNHIRAFFRNLEGVKGYFQNSRGLGADPLGLSMVIIIIIFTSSPIQEAYKNTNK